MQKVATQESIVTFLIDDSGRLTFSGELNCKRLGFQSAQLPDQSIFTQEDTFPMVISEIRKAFQGCHGEQEVISEGRTFINTYSSLTNERGKTTQVIGVSIDVTESKRTSEILRKSEFRLRTLFDSANDGIFTMDNKTFIDCNAAILRIFQCTRDQIVGQTPFRFSPSHQPDGRTSEVVAVEKINAVMEGIPQFFEWRHIRYDGTPFDAEVSLNRLDLEDEVYIQAMVRDVSERKKAEEENRRLAMVANTTTNMVVLADGTGRIEWVNPAFTRTTGYQLEEVKGRKPGSFLRGPESNKEVADFMRERIRAGQGFKDVEILNYTKSGIPFWVSVEVQPIHDKDGKAIQFIAVESDITERKATQQALLDRNEELIKINAELDRFVYSASHDLRAPIASLLGLIEVARLEKDMTNMSQLLDLQQKSLLRLDRFIKDIVDHSRNTRLAVEPELINFESMVNATLEHLQFMDNVTRIRRNICVKQEGDFYTAPTRLDIILNNLISNAVKYADVRKEDPFIEVNITANATQAIIRVRDNGEGIPKESLSKIFDMFFRASGKGSGSGLGLYIVKEAVQKIGGSIHVQSELYKETEFIVQIPNLNHHLVRQT